MLCMACSTCKCYNMPFVGISSLVVTLKSLTFTKDVRDSRKLSDVMRKFAVNFLHCDDVYTVRSRFEASSAAGNKEVNVTHVIFCPLKWPHLVREKC